MPNVQEKMYKKSKREKVLEHTGAVQLRLHRCLKYKKSEEHMRRKREGRRLCEWEG